MADQQAFIHRFTQCVARLRESGVDALGGLFDLTGQRLVRFAVTLTRHQQDAEDAVQTALVRLAGEPGLLARANCPWSYLLQMVRNEALLVLRRKQRCTTSPDRADLVTRCPVDDLEQEDLYLAGQARQWRQWLQQWESCRER